MPLTMPHGESKDKRPALQQCGFATLGGKRGVPLWGKPHEGTAAETTVPNTLLAAIAACLAQHGGAPGAYLSVADAARVTADHLTALGATRCISRLPATSTACGRLIPEAVAHTTWAEVGVRAHTKPTPYRPVTSYKA